MGNLRGVDKVDNMELVPVPFVVKRIFRSADRRDIIFGRYFFCASVDCRIVAAVTKDAHYRISGITDDG